MSMSSNYQANLPSSVQEPSLQDMSWEQRLEQVYELMAEMSQQTDPQAMVRAYGARMQKLVPVARRLSLSRRGLEAPEYRITRYSEWQEEVNPWKEKDRLPLLRGGLLADLLYSNRPHVIDELQLDPDDPAAPFLAGQQSLIAIPMLDGGEALNMVLATQSEPYGFDKERFPDTFWLANLFGRATYNLVLKDQVRAAYETIDRELKVVSNIQRSLLPTAMPDIPGLSLAAYYRTSQRAGGDYYDFFALAGGKWGILIADVSGHGTPAAVVMAITHSIAHLYPGDCGQPHALLEFVNRNLAQRYADGIEAFVTAFYGVYDPATRELTYSNAGHNPPRLWSCSRQQAKSLDGAASLPLGLMEDVQYENAKVQLELGDRLVLYTDGITEAMSPEGDLFGNARLDQIFTHSCRQGADDLVDAIVSRVADHTGDTPPTDDRTLVVATVGPKGSA